MSTDLLTPLTLRCGLALSNRIAKSAMTEALGDRARLPSPPLLRLYGRWADCGAGLMITGNVGIDRAHPVRARDVILGIPVLLIWQAVEGKRAFAAKEGDAV